MKIIPPAGFAAMPWRNGGGVTNEILKEERGGELLWRLSFAEVASDGPFSIFPGLSRILTVFEGEGLELTAGRQVMKALPFKPLAFSGDWPVTCRRIGGDVRDFNVIFDGGKIDAQIVVRSQDTKIDLSLAGACLNAVMCLGGGQAGGTSLEKGSVVVAGDELIVLGCKAPALQVLLAGRR